jgi:hypothetical protein
MRKNSRLFRMKPRMNGEHPKPDDYQYCGEKDGDAREMIKSLVYDMKSGYDCEGPRTGRCLRQHDSKERDD